MLIPIDNRDRHHRLNLKGARRSRNIANGFLILYHSLGWILFLCHYILCQQH